MSVNKPENHLDLISTEDQKRIQNDAAIARDKMASIYRVALDRDLHPMYLKEKLDAAQRCIDFMRGFCE